MKRLLLLTLMLAAILFTGCGKQTEKKITFSDTGIQSDVIGVAINGTTLTIRAAGTYVLTGSCKDGNIIIDAPNGKSVNLVLEEHHHRPPHLQRDALAGRPGQGCVGS